MKSWYRSFLPGSSGSSKSQGRVALFFLLIFLLLPINGQAVQFYFFYFFSTSEGGLGGDYFTGSPRFKNYDCRICHVNSPGKIKVNLWTEPVNIFQAGYVPGQTYTVRLSLEKELQGPETKIFSTNNFALEVLNSKGRNAGTFDLGFTWNILTQLLDPLVLSPDETVVLSGFFNMDSSWRWYWTAPSAGTGDVTFYLGFVDGSGDLKAFGDDVAVLKEKARELR